MESPAADSTGRPAARVAGWVRESFTVRESAGRGKYCGSPETCAIVRLRREASLKVEDRSKESGESHLDRQISLGGWPKKQLYSRLNWVALFVSGLNGRTGGVQTIYEHAFPRCMQPKLL